MLLYYFSHLFFINCGLKNAFIRKIFFLHELINGDLWREFPSFLSMTFFSSSLKGYDKNWLISYENVL